jgi:hypothetical protein
VLDPNGGWQRPGGLKWTPFFRPGMTVG